MNGHLGKQHSSVTLERRCRSVLRAHVRPSTLCAQGLPPPCIWPLLNRLHPSWIIRAGRTAVLFAWITAGVLAPSSAGAQPAPPTPTPPVTAKPQVAPSQDADQERLKRIQEKVKTVDPSMVIYLDSRGNVAGTGDPAGVVGRAEQAGKAAHPPALELSGFPKDRYDLVDWAATLVQGKIKPRDAIDPGVPEVPPFDLDIVITTKSKFQPDVVFSHKVHTLWLACENCHDKIFKKKAGGHPEMHMTKIAAGEYCGRCHDRVAFPLTDCLRCHVKPKSGAP